MLQRLIKIEVWKAVTETLSKAKTAKGSVKISRLTVSRYQVADLVALLEPFKEATMALQGDGVRSSLIIPALLGIDDSICNSPTQFTTLQQNLRKCMRDRIHELIRKAEYIVATILDCRCMLVPFDTGSGSANNNNDASANPTVRSRSSGSRSVTKEGATSTNYLVPCSSSVARTYHIITNDE